MSVLYTIGHSNRTLEEFLEIVVEQGITTIVDIRAFPGSRRLPWFNKQALQGALKAIGINYFHFPQLGGRRKAVKDSINKGWRNEGFRGFADYMQTEEFTEAMQELNQILKSHKRVAIMCAEAVPWRCHRSLISDAELVRGIEVKHILNMNPPENHTMTEFAVSDKKSRRVCYP